MAPPIKLGYGLNIPSKGNAKKPTTNAFAARSAGQKRKKTIFDDDSEEENDTSRKENVEEVTELTTFDTPSTNEPTPAPSKKPRPSDRSHTKKLAPPTPQEFLNLSSLRSSRKHAEEAQQLDPTIYDYDAVYESLHTAPSDAKKASSSEGPKYIKALLQSAEVRKRDQLRARERMLQREREAEGEEFADKEKFVTAAYKAQQEEVRRIEEEEEKRAREEEERRKGGVGMVGFYKSVLERDEERHEAAVRAAREVAERRKRGEIVEEDGKGNSAVDDGETRRAAELNAKGAHIAINEEGEVVDKRQLLSAGLNVAPKKAASADQNQREQKSTKPGYGPSAAAYKRDGGARAAQRERQTAMLAAQLEENMRAQKAEEEAKQKELAEKMKSRKSTADVQSAKERYLARKREREMAAKGDKSG